MGLADSPSCGIVTTSSGYTGGLPRAAEHAHVSGRGFLEELLAELERGAWLSWWNRKPTITIRKNHRTSFWESILQTIECSCYVSFLVFK